MGSCVDSLNSRSGCALQILLRFVTEIRPAVLLIFSFFTMFINWHDSLQAVWGLELMRENITACIPNLTCEIDTLLDLNDPNGSWNYSIIENPLFTTTVAALSGLFSILLVMASWPFLTFRRPAELLDGDLIDTALCFHINIFNKRAFVRHGKKVIIFLGLVGDVFVVAMGPNPLLALRVLAFPVIVGYMAVLTLYPFARYYQMSYDQFVSISKGDSIRVGPPESGFFRICIKLLIQNSKSRVMDEVSRHVVSGKGNPIKVQSPRQAFVGPPSPKSQESSSAWERLVQKSPSSSRR